MQSKLRDPEESENTDDILSDIFNMKKNQQRMSEINHGKEGISSVGKGGNSSVKKRGIEVMEKRKIQCENMRYLRIQ